MKRVVRSHSPEPKQQQQRRAAAAARSNARSRQRYQRRYTRIFCMKYRHEKYSEFGVEENPFLCFRRRTDSASWEGGNKDRPITEMAQAGPACLYK